MPLGEDGVVSREPDGSFNEDYRKWCYADGAFVYTSKDALPDYLLAHAPNPYDTPEPERRRTCDGRLSQLKHRKK